MQDASWVEFRGFTFEDTRGTAIQIRGGDHNRVVGCTIRNTGNSAVNIEGGTYSGVVGCDIYENGDGGIELSGGDRKTLTPCHLFADNNNIHDFSRWDHTYRPAIAVNGDGVEVTHNLLYNGPHNAIQLSGNDHQIEYNELHSVAYDTGDVGAFYMGRDWTARGTQIRYNYFHDIQGPGQLGAMGVYLDDQASGITIEGNLFKNVTRAAFVGGGCDNHILNNIFVDCTPAVHIDARGLGWQKKGTLDPNDTLQTGLRAMPYTDALWSARYPNLVNILHDDPGTPKRNVVERNVSVRGKFLDIEAIGAPYQIVKDNLADADPLFRDVAKGDYRLRPGAPALPAGFQPLPIQKMGLYEFPDRASWPVRHPIRPVSPPEPAAVARKPRKGPLPVIMVPRAKGPAQLTGSLNPAEWGGLDLTHSIPIARGVEDEATGPPSHAWLRWDESGLFIAIDNEVDPNATLHRGDTWGQDDAVEVALRAAGAPATAPVYLYRGFPSGHFLVSTEAGLSAAEAKRATAGVEYAAQVVNQVRWTAEWRIPWSSIGVQPKVGTRLAFNLTVHKSASSAWIMWRGTGGNSFLVEQTGFLQLAPAQ